MQNRSYIESDAAHLATAGLALVHKSWPGLVQQTAIVFTYIKYALPPTIINIQEY
jgi:hypothetical protein